MIELSTSQLTTPLIIYKGIFGGTLMKNWATFKEQIGVIIDKGSLNTSPKILVWKEETNKTENFKSFINSLNLL
jgi:hypothetical protein